MKVKNIVYSAGLLLLSCSLLLAQPTPQTAVTVTWKISPSSNIISQTVWWGQTTNYDKSFNLPPAATTYQIGGLIPATTYHVALQCTQGVGSSVTNYVPSLKSGDLIYTTQPVDKPNPPSMPQPDYGTMPKPPPANAVNIRWTLSVSTNILQQTVWWGPSVGNYPNNMNVPPTSTSCQIAGLSPGTSYHIVVSCTQGIGTGMTNLVPSNMSGELVYTTTPTERPLAPATPQVLSAP